MQWEDEDALDTKQVVIDIIDVNPSNEKKVEYLKVVITSVIWEGAVTLDGSGEVSIIELTGIPTLNQWALLLLTLVTGLI